MRLFIGLSLPSTLCERLSELEQGLPGARWVETENLHLTVRFVGEVDGGAARDLDTALAQVRAQRLWITLSGVGQFGQNRRLRTLWAGVEPSAELGRLYHKVDQAVQSIGLPPERRKFKPHVTLARFKVDPGARLAAYLAAHELFRADPFEVRELVLYSSFLGRTGAIYAPEAVYPLLL